MQHLSLKSFDSYVSDTYDKDLLYQIYPQKLDNTNPKYIKIDDKYIGTPENNVSKKLLTAAGVKYRKYEKTNQEINLTL